MECQLLIRTTHSMQQLQVLQQMNHGFKQWRNYILKFKMKEMNGVIHNSGNQIKIFFLQRLMKNVSRISSGKWSWQTEFF